LAAEQAAPATAQPDAPLVDAAKTYVTLGEMCDALRKLWGTWNRDAVF